MAVSPVLEATCCVHKRMCVRQIFGLTGWRGRVGAECLASGRSAQHGGVECGDACVGGAMNAPNNNTDQIKASVRQHMYAALTILPLTTPPPQDTYDTQPKPMPHTAQPTTACTDDDCKAACICPAAGVCKHKHSSVLCKQATHFFGHCKGQTQTWAHMLTPPPCPPHPLLPLKSCCAVSAADC